MRPRPYLQRRATRDGLVKIGRDLLTLLGEDASSDRLVDTPRRWADQWLEFLTPPAFSDTAFEVTHTDQMVVVAGMRVWSLCEHHLLPFWCDVTIGYVARDRVLGLSKFARIAHHYARRLQMQERLVTDIADHIVRATKSDDVAVLARGEHLCMTMRGVRTPATMISSALRGVFRVDAAARAEFLAFARSDGAR